MNHTGSVDSSGYERWLDLNDSVAGVFYTVGGVPFMREYVASYPDDVIAVHFTAGESGALSFNINLQRGESLNRWQDYSEHTDQHTVVIGAGAGGTDGIQYAAGARVVATGGSVYALGENVFVQGADEAILFFTAWTSFRKSDPKSAVLATLAATADTTYAAVRERHIADYTALQGRVALDLGTSSAQQKSLATAARMEALAQAFDPELAALYFQFGRYLLISTSREGTLPPNLQGIWCISQDPMWGSKYTGNINLGEYCFCAV